VVDETGRTVWRGVIRSRKRVTAASCLKGLRVFHSSIRQTGGFFDGRDRPSSPPHDRGHDGPQSIQFSRSTLLRAPSQRRNAAASALLSFAGNHQWKGSPLRRRTATSCMGPRLSCRASDFVQSLATSRRKIGNSGEAVTGLHNTKPPPGERRGTRSSRGCQRA
jgi:hypothetical protein